MGADLGIIEIFHWVTYVYPSLGNYTKILIPLLIFFISVVGMFSNILPKPGDIYSIPDIIDLDLELKHRNKVIYLIVRLSRCITIQINRVIKSRIYSYFYKFTKLCANILKRLKGGIVSSDVVKITKPKPYEINIEKFDIDDQR